MNLRIIRALALLPMLLLPLFGEEVREWEIRGKNYEAQYLGYDVEKGVQLKIAGNGKVGFIPLELIGKLDAKYALRKYAGGAVVQVVSLVKQKEDRDAYFPFPRQKPSADGWVEAGTGSGFMIGPRHLVTNFHVVQAAEKVRIRTNADAELEVDGTVYLDRDRDVAVIRLAKIPDPALSVLTFRPGEPPETGDAVWTIGHPRGFKDTASWGEVNALRSKEKFPKGIREYLRSPEGTRYIQTDAVILHGSSGSPLMDQQARVIGVNTFLFGDRIGVAVLSKEFEKAVQAAAADAEAELTSFPLNPGPSENPFLRYPDNVAEILNPLMEQKEKTRGVEAVFKPHIETAVAGYDKLLADPNTDQWARFQARIFRLNAIAYYDPKEQMDQFVQNADEIHEQYADSDWLGHAAMQMYEGSGELRHAFLRRLADKEDLPPNNQYRVNLALLLNLLHRRVKWRDVEPFDPARNRSLMEKAHAKLTYLIESPDVVVQVDMFEMMSARNAMKQINLENLEGAKAPSLVAKDVDGNAHDLAELRGKVVFVDFFSNECGSCRTFYPYLAGLKVRMTHRPFALLAVNCDKPEVLAEVIAENKVSWPCIADGTNGPVAKAWGVESHPARFIIDHKGVVRFEGGTSYINQAKMTTYVERLVNQAEEDSGAAPAKPVDELPVPAATTALTIDAALKKKLVLHYSFNDDTGTKVLDASGRKTHGTRTAALTYVAGKHGRGVRITGPDTLVESKDWDLNSSGWAGLSVAAWVRLEKETENAYVFSRGSTDPKSNTVYDLTLGGRKGTGTLSLRKGMFRHKGGVFSKHYFGAARPPLHQWFHVVGTSDAKTVRFYVNGVLDGESSLLEKAKAKDSRFNIFTIGKSRGTREDRPGNHLDGVVDEVMVWERTLSAEEVDKVFRLVP